MNKVNPVLPNTNPITAEVLKFALVCQSEDFIRLWLQGDFETIRFHWPEAPEAIYPDNKVSAPVALDTKPTNPKDIIGMRKAPMSTVPAGVLAEIGVAMLEGAVKYGRHNYRAVGVRASVYYDATQRHLQSWWEGEDIDPDSWLPHVTKAISSLVVLRDAMIQGKMTDDRPPRSAEFYKELNSTSARIIDTYAHMKPKHYTIHDDVSGT